MIGGRTVVSHRARLAWRRDEHLVDEDWALAADVLHQIREPRALA